jgi:general secretion pathway protein K
MRQEGIALVIVLWLIVLLSTIAAGHVRNVHSETRLAMHSVQLAKARALAGAGIQRAILGLLRPNKGDQWPVDGTVQRLELGGHEIQVAVRDATGLVDLNLANAELLKVLFSVMGNDTQQQIKLVDALLDWRDPDDLSHLYGAEDDDYRAAGLTWTAHDAAFSSIEELRYLIGMTPQKFAAIAPYITVYSDRAALNINYAPLELISVLTGQNPPDETSESSPVRKSESPATSHPGTSHRGTYHIYAGASRDGGVIASVEAVVNISNSSAKPYTVLNWQEPARFKFRKGG